MSEKRFISRADAEVKLRQAERRRLSELAKFQLVEELIRQWEPRCGWHRVRNYEYEHKLEQALGGEWVVNEFCPMNGKYCSWGDYVGESSDG